MAISHRLLLAVVAVMAGAALVGMVILWPSPDATPPLPEAGAQTTEYLDATILASEEIPGGDELAFLVDARNLRITVEIADTGERVTFEQIDETGRTFAPGQRVELAVIDTEGQPTQRYINDFQRGRPMVWLTALFVAAVLAFGRFQGLRALLGLGLTFVVIAVFIVPAILDERSPVAVALVGSFVIMLVTLYLSHGPSRKTTAAVVGTAAALLLTVALAALFVTAASITGFTSEEARLANVAFGGLPLRGLLLAGIIIGGLGVLDDVTLSQASTVFELKRSNPAATFTELLRGALNVGRDHIAATINTLFLAYAGAGLPLLILFVSGADPFVDIVTQEVVAVEVVRTLVGSVGLVAAVPLTTALAASLAVSDPAAAVREATAGHGLADGHGRRPGGAPTRHAGDAPARSAGDAPGRSAADPATPAEPAATPPGQPVREARESEDDWVERLRGAYRLRSSDRSDQRPGDRGHHRPEQEPDEPGTAP